MIKTKLTSAMCELIVFVKDGQRATIATNGERHVAQIPSGKCIEYWTLRQAISALAARGWRVDPGLSTNF